MCDHSPLYVYLELFQPASPSHFASVWAAVPTAVVRYILLSTTSMTGALLVRAVVLLSRPKRVSTHGAGDAAAQRWYVKPTTNGQRPRGLHVHLWNRSLPAHLTTYCRDP
jgi:hypothetical protein